jgi:hypothetical protein
LSGNSTQIQQALGDEILKNPHTPKALEDAGLDGISKESLVNAIDNAVTQSLTDHGVDMSVVQSIRDSI